ncbi:MAG: transposase [Actinomycetota bacterium]
MLTGDWRDWDTTTSPGCSRGSKAHELLPQVHLVISNFKRWILDVFHGVSAKHLQSYLDEFCYRLNRRLRANRSLGGGVLNRCARFTGPVTYAELTAT